MTTHLIFSAKQLKKMKMKMISTLNSMVTVTHHLYQKRSALEINAPVTEACRTKQKQEELAKHGTLSHQSNISIPHKSTYKLVFKEITAETQVRVARDFGVTSLTPTGNGTGTTVHHLQKLS